MPSRHGFTYEINDFDDVRNHLDALWYEFNKLCQHLAISQPCSDPPSTCQSTQSGRKRPSQAAKRGSKTR